MSYRPFSVHPKAKVYAYSAPVSMALGFPRLEIMVQEKMRKTPSSGDLYLFHNKKGNYIKVFYFDNHGYCILAKKLDSGVFDTAKFSGELNTTELTGLVNEVIIRGAKKEAYPKVIKRKKAA